MLELREFKAGHESEWDNLVLASPHGLLFHLTDWLKIVSETQRLSLVRLGIFEGEHLIGVFPLFLKRFGPLHVAGSPFVVEDTPYMGPVVADERLSEVMRLFVDYMKTERINYARVIFRYDRSRALFQEQGYECVDNLTHVVDLRQDQVQLWKRLKPSCKGKIRKAERAGVKTEIIRDDRYLDAYFKLVIDLYARQGRIPPSPKDFFQDIWNRFGSKGDLVWVVATYKGALVAASLLAVWRGGVYYLDGACNKENVGLGINNAVQWAAIQWAKAEGCSSYDFVGSNLPRLFEFKSSFGGDLNTYLTIERSHPAWVRSLRQRYASYKVLLHRIRLMLAPSGS
jgi:hypothetical protein